jgi:hypothetical protein
VAVGWGKGVAVFSGGMILNALESTGGNGVTSKIALSQAGRRNTSKSIEVVINLFTMNLRIANILSKNLLTKGKKSSKIGIVV